MMRTPVILALLALAVYDSDALSCYKCTLQPPNRTSNETARVCAHFDPSDPRYQVDCPFSTYCMKKSIQLDLPGGKTVRGAIRDCAAQKHSYNKYFEKSGWQMTASVDTTAYTAGCQAGPVQAGVAQTADRYCYCDTSLCNAAPPTREPSASHTDAMAVIFVFNAMKYIRSLR